MKLSKRLLIISLSLGAVLHAGAQVTWTGGGTDNLWSDAANWGGTAPVSGNSLTFDGSTRLTATYDIAPNNLAFGAIAFSSNAGAFILNGTGSTTQIRPGNITDSSTATETINLKLVMTATRAVSVTDSGSLVLGGVVSSNNNGNFGITKSGNGTLTLSATGNSYAGATTVSAGTLKLTGTLTASATTIGGTGMLTGTGTALGLTLNSGGTIAAGLGGSDTTGNLKASSLIWNSATSASALTFNLDAGSTNSTSLTLSGAFTQGNSGSPFDINLTGNGTFASAGVYDLLNFGSTNFTDASQFNLISSLNLDPGFTGALVLNGNQLDFDVTALSVPEPGTWALMLGGLGVLVFWQRRRSNA